MKKIISILFMFFISCSAIASGFSDNDEVYRGGLCGLEDFAYGSGVTVDSSGKLQGVSVNVAPGKSIGQGTNGLKNGQVGVSTVGKIRAAGGDVEPKPTRNNPYHSILSGITASQATALFTPTVKNPSK